MKNVTLHRGSFTARAAALALALGCSGSAWAGNTDEQTEFNLSLTQGAPGVSELEQGNYQAAVREALKPALFLTLSKFPNVIGMLRFHLRRIAHRKMTIIEYK